jgi:putative selenate reductase
LTFCPENGDPAVLKPRLYLDESRFSMAEGPRFLLDLANGIEGISITASDGLADQVPRLLSVLQADEGLPVPTA